MASPQLTWRCPSNAGCASWCPSTPALIPNRISEYVLSAVRQPGRVLHQPRLQQRAALDRMAERLLDLNRSIGRPDKLSTVFGYRITKAYRGGLKTQIADHHLGNPVIRSEYKDSSIKQYVRDHRLLRTEATSYNTPDLGVGEIHPQPAATPPGACAGSTTATSPSNRTCWKRTSIVGNWHACANRPSPQADVEHQVSSWTIHGCWPSCRRSPASPMSHAAAGFGRAICTSRRPKPSALTTATYRLGAVALRPGQAARQGPGPQSAEVPRRTVSRRRASVICVLFLKLFHRVYAPFTAAVLQPIADDAILPDDRRATSRSLCTLASTTPSISYLTTSGSTSLPDFHARSTKPLTS